MRKSTTFWQRYVMTFCFWGMLAILHPAVDMAFAQSAAENFAAASIESISKEINQKIFVKDGLQAKATEAANFMRLSSPGDIENRLLIMQELGKISTEMVALLRAGPAKAFLAARANGLSVPEAERVMSIVSDSLEEAKAGRMVLKMQADREWAKLHVAVYNLLAKEPGNWRPAVGDQIISVTEGADEFRNQLIVLIDSIKAVEDRADKILDSINQP